MRARTIVTAALIGVLSIAATGCDQMTERFKPEPKIVTREATVAVAAAPVVGSFRDAVPNGLPLWPTAKVVEPEKRAKASKSWDETLLAADTYEDVLAGTVTGLERGGWQVETIDASTEEASATVLNVAGNGREGVITITRTPEGTTIGYVIAAPE